jgi:hypothetical protein
MEEATNSSVAATNSIGDIVGLWSCRAERQDLVDAELAHVSQVFEPAGIGGLGRDRLRKLTASALRTTQAWAPTVFTSSRRLSACSHGACQ